MKWHHTFACLALAVTTPAEGAPDHPDDRYAGRDGKAEALADLARGKSARLYSHGYDGEFPGYRTPGLLNCDPDQNEGSEAAKDLFAPLPEANAREDRVPTPEEDRRATSAYLFAKDYNLTIFRKRTVEIMRICPAVSEEE